MNRFRILKYDSLASTQDKAKELITTENNIDNVVVVAKQQTKGYGRFKRKWVSPKGGLWFSFILKSKMELSSISQFVALTAVSICESIKSVTGINEIYIKWPNDVVYIENDKCAKYKKISGCIIETMKHNSNLFIIIGVGINVNNSIPTELKDIAVSLKKITDKELALMDLLGIFLKIYLKNYLKFKKQGFTPILKKYKNNSIILGKRVKIIQGNKSYTVKVLDINEDASLLVSNKGKKSIFYAGDLQIKNCC